MLKQRLAAYLRIQRLRRNHPLLARTIQAVRMQHLTYLDAAALCDLALRVIALHHNGIAGDIIETGCALGGSAIVLAQAKTTQQPLWLYDVFGIIPPPSEHDGRDVHQRYQTIVTGAAQGLNGERYYGYEANLYAKVRTTLQDFGFDVQREHIHMVQGLYQDTLPAWNRAVALAHIDCDWYDSVMVCLQAIEPHLVPGGTLVIDDYYTWSGCTSAVDDYFRTKDRSAYRFEHKSRLHITRIS